MEKMQRPFAVFDIDGTLIRWQLYHAIVDELARQGHISKKGYDAIRHARMNWKRRAPGASFKTYEAELIRVYVDSLSNLSPTKLEEAAKAAFEEYKDQVYTYTRDLIAELKAKDYLIFAISGSHAEVVSKMAGHYGFDDFIGTEFVSNKNQLTGEVIAAYHDKDLSLKKLVNRNNATYSGSFAVGDSLSDAKMMELVENPIAFNPDADLLAHARQKGWRVVVERKNVIYQLGKDGNSYLLA